MRILDFHDVLPGTPRGEIERHIAELIVAREATSRVSSNRLLD